MSSLSFTTKFLFKRVCGPDLQKFRACRHSQRDTGKKFVGKSFQLNKEQQFKFKVR